MRRFGRRWRSAPVVGGGAVLDVVDVEAAGVLAVALLKRVGVIRAGDVFMSGVSIPMADTTFCASETRLQSKVPM